MTWTHITIILLAVPLLVALAEWSWTRLGPRDVGFWSFAREVGGTCHLRWGRGQSPVIRFALPGAEGRARAVRVQGLWAVEVRAYLNGHAGMVTRLCTPPEAPLRWRAPGLAPIAETGPAGASVETTEVHPWQRLWSEPALQGPMAALASAGPMSFLVAGRVLILRRIGETGVPAGDVVEQFGPGAVATLRAWTAHLDGQTVDDPGGSHAPIATVADADAVVAPPRDFRRAHRALGCGACASALDDDPHRCPGCGAVHHRGCREMLAGCTTADCTLAPDRAPKASPTG
jgi:hypothetical protein